MTLDTPCREYMGYRNAAGYGCRRGAGRRFGTQFVHRQMWIMAHGPIPEGAKVLHHCDNPPCFRLDHLYLGTQADNMRDRRDRNGNWKNGRESLTHCKHGHEFTPENTRIDGRGVRLCRTCCRARNARYNAKRGTT